MITQNKLNPDSLMRPVSPRVTLQRKIGRDPLSQVTGPGWRLSGCFAFCRAPMSWQGSPSSVVDDVIFRVVVTQNAHPRPPPRSRKCQPTTAATKEEFSRIFRELARREIPSPVLLRLMVKVVVSYGTWATCWRWRRKRVCFSFSQLKASSGWGYSGGTNWRRSRQTVAWESGMVIVPGRIEFADIFHVKYR